MHRSNCDFNDQYLPVMFVDEDIYLSPPEVLIGTIDKFAQLPGKKKSLDYSATKIAVKKGLRMLIHQV